MADTVTETVLEDFDAEDAQSSGGTVNRWFDGIYWPKHLVSIELAGLPPSGTTLVLNVGPGLDTATLGGGTYVTLAEPIRSIRWGRGRDSPVDPANPGSCTIVFGNQSGNLDPTNIAGPYWPSIDMGLPVRVQYELGGVLYDRFAGELADVSMDAGFDPTVIFTVADPLEKIGRARLHPTETPQFDNELSGARMGHVLDQAGYPTSLRSIDPGNAILAPTFFGETAVEEARKTEQTEFGFLFADGAGNIVFYDRYRSTIATRSTVVQASITDQVGAGELGMMELEVARSRELVFNDWHIIRDPVGEGDEPVEQVATDQTSAAKYGLLSSPGGFGELCRIDEEALAMAQGLLSWFKDPANRIREVRLNALHPRITDESLWPTLLNLQLLDRISVRRDYGPVTVGPTQLLIQAIEEEIDANEPSWQLRLTTSNPTPSSDFFVLDTDVLDTGALGW